MADRYYTLHIAGCTRNLPILNVTDKLAIAGFVMLGDVELTDACAQALAKKVPSETDYVLTAETKGIPLAEELARALGMDRYIVARKSVKAYMENALWVDDVSITTKGTQKLCLDGTDIERIKGKNVLLLDDVMSELDVKRRQQLLHFIRRERIQTLITATDAAYFPAEGMGQYYHVRSGQIST